MNSKYFYQYESPNIVIVPTMSCNPPSPKRRKIGNNIIVPIVNNAVCENLMSTHEKIPRDDSNDNKKVDKNEMSKSPAQKSSWAANYLQSIGLDKTSSIWNRKIPRKPTSQTCVFSAELPKNTSVPISNSTYAPKIDIKKNVQLNVHNKMEAEPNILKDSNTKNKDVKETKNLSINYGSKKNKHSNHESNKHDLVKNTTDVKNNKTLNILTCKNKNICNDLSKIKTEKSKKNVHTINLCTSDNSHKKSKQSQKDTKSKLPLNNSSIKQTSKKENKVKKSSVKSVVVKEAQDSRKSNETKLPRRDSANQSTSSSSVYKEKYKDSKYSVRKITPTSPRKNIKVTKKCDKVDDYKKAHVLKKTQNNIANNSKEIHNKKNTGSKTKTKEKSSKIKLDNKIIESPIKRKTSKTKTYRKIKLVINVICNKNQSPVKCNESSNNEKNSGTKTCTLSNIDLDFLNDFNIDEIVESLDTCEKAESQNILSNHESNIGNTAKQSMISNVQNVNINNTDAIDLIKTLKGEEDDDLIRISSENAKELLFRNVANITQSNNNSQSMINKVSKSDNRTILNDFPTVLIKTEEKEFETVLCNTPCNVMVDNNVSPVNIEQSVEGKEKHETMIIKKGKDSKNDGSGSPTQNVSRDTLRCSAMELGDNKIENNILIKEEQDVSSFISKTDSLNAFSEVTYNSCEKFKIDDVVKENINKENIEYGDINTNSNKRLDEQTVERKEKDENKDKSPITQNTVLRATANEIVDKENSSYLYSSSMLQTDNNRTHYKTDNESIQNKETDHDLLQQKPETSDSQLPKLASKQQENKICYNDDECIKTNSENENWTINKIATNEEVIVQHNENVINNKDKNNTAIINDAVNKQPEVPDRKVQDDKHKPNKEECNAQKDFKENKQSNLKINTKIAESQTKLLESDEHPRGSIKTKDCQETIRKLEERLYSSSGSKYSIISNIHAGRFSKIFKCKHPNGKYYALKMLTKNKYNLGKEKKDMLHCLISDIPKNNLFIVNLVKAFNLGDKWCFLMEYYPKNLHQALDEAGKSFSIHHIQDFARQLVMAVMVLRNKNMVHLDINPKHILINSSNNMLKLSGFDNLCYVNKMQVLPNVGTANYRAPEVILGYQSGHAIDVWCTGLVLYEMATNMKLFPGLYNNDILYKQICTLGCIPYDMLKKSRFNAVHFIGSKFMRRSGFKGQTVKIVSKFYKNNRLCDSIYEIYYENWGQNRSVSQQNFDIGKISQFVKLLQKMLTMNPESRLPIEFVYANPFIFDAYSCQKW